MRQSPSLRRYTMHAAHRKVGVLSRAAACVGSARPLRVGMIAGTLDDAWYWCTAVLAEALSERGPIEICWPWDPTELPADDWFDCDALVLLGHRAARLSEQWADLRHLCLRAGAVVALDAASRAWADWPRCSEDLPDLGEPRAADLLPVEIEPAAEAGDHPVLAGVGRFACTLDTRLVPRLDAAATVLLRARGGGHALPVAWVRGHPHGRAVLSPLGRPEDFHHAEFVRLVARAVRWTTSAPA